MFRQCGVYNMMSVAVTYGRYNYNPLVCDVERAASSVYFQLFSVVSLSTCRLLCTVDFDDTCSGFFWYRTLGQCWLTSYTGDYDNDTACTNTPAHSTMFFRRHRFPCK